MPETASSQGSNVLLDDLRRAVISRGTKELPDSAVENGIRGAFAQALLFSDILTVGIRGPNLELITLLRWLGRGQVEALIQDGTIRFAYAAGNFAYLTPANAQFMGAKKPGLEVMNMVGPGSQDPLSATLLALGEQAGLPERDSREIARLVAQNTIDLTEKNIFEQARDAAKSDAHSVVGETIGLSNIDDPDSGNLSSDLTHRYLGVAVAHATLLFAAHAECTEIMGSDLSDLVLQNRIAKSFQSTPRPSDRFCSIVDFETVPDLGQALSDGSISLNDILRLRNSNDGHRFRQWLFSLDTTGDTETLREYTKWLSCNIPTASSKIVRLLLHTGLAAALSVAGPLTGIIGGTALNVYEAFFRERLKGGWVPRLFVERVKNALKH